MTNDKIYESIYDITDIVEENKQKLTDNHYKSIMEKLSDIRLNTNKNQLYEFKILEQKVVEVRSSKSCDPRCQSDIESMEGEDFYYKIEKKIVKHIIPKNNIYVPHECHGMISDTWDEEDLEKLIYQDIEIRNAGDFENGKYILKSPNYNLIHENWNRFENENFSNNGICPNTIKVGIQVTPYIFLSYKTI